MRIDNSMAQAWRKCPLNYWEKYEAHYPGADQLGIEPNFGRENLDFGSRMHELRQFYYHTLMKHYFVDEPLKPLDDPKLEAEAQATWAQYLAHYPVEDFEIVETEQTRVVKLPDLCPKCYSAEHVIVDEHADVWPGSMYCQLCDLRFYTNRHELVVKLDALIRRQGVLQVNDLKTEGRRANNNDPENWAAKPQVSLYVYAAKQLYPNEKVSDEIFLDVIKRQSDKGQKGPEFFRDAPRRSERQISEDLRDLVWVADQITECERTGYWPMFKDNCKRGNWKCDYFGLHIPCDEARADVLGKYYRPAEPYLQIEEHI